MNKINFAPKLILLFFLPYEGSLVTVLRLGKLVGRDDFWLRGPWETFNRCPSERRVGLV